MQQKQILLKNEVKYYNFKPPTGDNKDDDASPDINDVQDIHSYNAVAVAGIHLTCMLDKGGQDLQAFWNICFNKLNVVFATCTS